MNREGNSETYFGSSIVYSMRECSDRCWLPIIYDTVSFTWIERASSGNSLASESNNVYSYCVSWKVSPTNSSTNIVQGMITDRSYLRGRNVVLNELTYRPYVSFSYQLSRPKAERSSEANTCSTQVVTPQQISVRRKITYMLTGCTAAMSLLRLPCPYLPGVFSKLVTLKRYIGKFTSAFNDEGPKSRTQDVIQVRRWPYA